MRQHIDVLAHGMRFYGSLMAAICALGSVAAAGIGLWAGEPVLVLIAPVLVGVGACAASPFWIAGRGLLERRPWARPLGLVLSLLILGDLPIGASLGLLGLGVLLDDDVARSFQPTASPLLLT